MSETLFENQNNSVSANMNTMSRLQNITIYMFTQCKMCLLIFKK